MLTAKGNGRLKEMFPQEAKPQKETITIGEPQFKVLTVKIKGIAPYVQDAFPARAIDSLAAKDAMDEAEKKLKRKSKPKRKYDLEFEQAQHRMKNGKNGIPTNAFKIAMKDACGLCDFSKKKADLTITIQSDGLDKFSGVSLVEIKGKPELFQSIGYNRSMSSRTPCVRIRAKYENWSCVLRIQYDDGQLHASDVFNLLYRAGRQVGIGNGRPGSPASSGQGWGLFDVELA